MDICFNVIKFSLIIICMVFLHTVQTECDCFVNVAQHLATREEFTFLQDCHLQLLACSVHQEDRDRGKFSSMRGGFGPEELQQAAISSSSNK